MTTTGLDRPKEPDLEVTKVGEALAGQFLKEVSAAVGLPISVCEILLKSGWALELDINAPTKWVKTLPRI